MSTSTSCTGLGVDEREHAAVGQLELARVEDLDGDDLLAGGDQQAQRARPAGRVAEVGDDDDEARLARQPAHADQRRRPRPSARRAVGRDALRRAAGRRRRARGGRRAGGSTIGRGAAGGDDADAPAAARGRGARRPSSRPRRRRSSAAPAVPNAIDGETSSDDPGRQRALGHVLAHVRHAGARARRRVDLAHVVADLVGPQLRELGARRRRRSPRWSPGQRARRRAARARGRARRPRPPASDPGPDGPAGRRAWARRRLTRRSVAAHRRGLDGLEHAGRGSRRR